MNYKDMTFCTFYKDCKLADECHRPLTQKVQSDADKWWGEGPGEAPIAQFMFVPDCWEDKDEI